MILNADKHHILAVDDDNRIRRLLAQYLSKQGYVVVTAKDAADARLVLKDYTFDLCILDIMMPGESGLDLAKYIGLSYDIPVLLLTAMTESQDRIAGLEVGADDYLPKPFEPKELLLRVQAILRRTAKQPVAIPVQKINEIRLDGYVYTDEALQADDGSVLSLTDGERALLDALLQKPNIPIRREALAAQLDLESNDRAVDVQITRLRKKIETDPAKPTIIQTVRGKGYLVKVVDNQ